MQRSASAGSIIAASCCSSCAQQRYRAGEATIALAALSVDELRRAGDPAEVCLTAFGHAFAQLWSGDVAKADESLQQVLRETVRLGDAERNMLCLTYLAVSARFLHDVDRAEAFAHAAMSAARHNGARHYEGVAHSNLAWVAWRRGNRAAALAGIATADPVRRLGSRTRRLVGCIARTSEAAVSGQREHAAARGEGCGNRPAAEL